MRQLSPQDRPDNKASDSLKLGPGEDPWQGLHRVMARQLFSAISDLNSLQTETALHNLRRATKLIRALLELRCPGKRQRKPCSLALLGIRPRSLGALEAILKPLAQTATPARDLHVQIRLLRRLQNQRTLSAELRLCQFLEQRCYLQLDLIGPIKPKLLAGLKNAIETLPERPEKHLQLEDLKRGWLHANKRACKAGRKARSNPTDSALHRWRKRSKALWYITRFLPSSLVPGKKRQLRELKKLTDLLGDDHDLALLEQSLSIVRSRARRRLQVHIGEMRSRLQKKIFRHKPL